MPNGIAPAIQFNPIPPGETIEQTAGESVRSRVTAPPVPADLEQLAFLPVTHLAELIRTRAVTSVELTRMYLERIRRLDPHLKAVVT